MSTGCVTSDTDPNPSFAEKSHINKKKATMAVITVSIIYTICWVPVCVMYCLIQLSPNLMRLSYQHKVTILLAMFNASVNPVVYSFTSAQFRQHVINLFRCKCCRVVPKVDWTRDIRHWSPSSPGQPQGILTFTL